MATAEQVIAIARKELNYKESPANSNRTKYGKWYGLDGKPWCMMFVMWVFHQAGADKLLPVKTASCGEFARAAKKAGNWHTKDFQPGDVIIYDFPGGSSPDHTGIVSAVGNGTVTTLEGNTSAGSNANGGMVMERTRKLSVVVGAFRPAYPEKKPMSIGDVVKFIGSKLYFGSGEESVSTPAASAIAKIDTIEAAAAHPYHVYGENGEEGWVDAVDLDNAGLLNREVIVTAKPSLRLRSGPAVTYPKLGSLEQGTKVTVIEVNGDWGRVSGGWINLNYVKDA